MNYSELILELYERVRKLEKQVEYLTNLIDVKKDITMESREYDYSISRNSMKMFDADVMEGKRDTTKYLFDGVVYPKNKLVLAVVKDYCSKHSDITSTQLLSKFDKSLQGSLGVLEIKEIAQRRIDYTKRFFTNEEDIIKTADNVVFYVCSQWGIINLPRFLTYVTENLGYQIKEIK